jgi:hypothetical protein
VIVPAAASTAITAAAIKAPVALPCPELLPLDAARGLVSPPGPGCAAVLELTAVEEVGELLAPADAVGCTTALGVECAEWW